MNQEIIKLAGVLDQLSIKARLQDLAIQFGITEFGRVSQIATVIDSLGPGAYLIGAGPYAQSVYSVMSEEVILGRLATPLEKPLDKAVDIFCQDNASLVPREVSRYHASITRSEGDDAQYYVRDLGSTCGTYVNGKLLNASDSDETPQELQPGDVVSLGPSHVNCFVFFRREL